MQSRNKTVVLILLYAILSVSASRTLQQGRSTTTTTTVVTSTSSGPGRIARSTSLVSSRSPTPKKEAPPKTDIRVDVYCLLDVTERSRGRLRSISVLAKDIVKDVFETSTRVRFGVGEYKDTKDGFSFLNRQTITNQQDKAIEALKALEFQSGKEKEESQLYALEKVAKDGDIGFRTKPSIKVIVWVGDTEGRDPIAGASEASVIEALKKKGIYVVAIDVGSLDKKGQATRIIKARGGALLKRNDAGQYDIVLLETDPIKGSGKGDSVKVTTDDIDGPLDLDKAVVKSVRTIVRAAEA